MTRFLLTLALATVCAAPGAHAQEKIKIGFLPGVVDPFYQVMQLGVEKAAKDLGVAASDIPASKSRGKETFFDGKVFDPENPAAYLKSLTIKRVEV